MERRNGNSFGHKKSIAAIVHCGKKPQVEESWYSVFMSLSLQGKPLMTFRKIFKEKKVYFHEMRYIPHSLTLSFESRKL